jgi:hypothetical protein
MSLQKSIPVITSIALILLVAVLRDRSRTWAAILATMPLNIPLAIWVIASGSENDPAIVGDTLHSIIIGMLAGVVWMAVVYGLVRAGWGVALAIGGGYVVWAVLIAALFWWGVLKWPQA